MAQHYTKFSQGTSQIYARQHNFNQILHLNSSHAWVLSGVMISFTYSIRLHLTRVADIYSSHGIVRWTVSIYQSPTPNKIRPSLRCLLIDWQVNSNVLFPAILTPNQRLPLSPHLYSWTKKYIRQGWQNLLDTTNYLFIESPAMKLIDWFGLIDLVDNALDGTAAPLCKDVLKAISV